MNDRRAGCKKIGPSMCPKNDISLFWGFSDLASCSRKRISLEKKGANAIVKKKTKTANASDDGVKKQADTQELKMEKNNMYSS